MNKHFIQTADQETADILKSIGFPQIGHSKDIYTFANCPSLTFANVDININKLTYTNIYCAS